MEFGTDEQKERYLAPLVRGEIRSCFTMTEPEFAGSNPVLDGRPPPSGTATSGSSAATSGSPPAADGAAFAICMAITDPDAEDRTAAPACSSCPPTPRATSSSATSRSWATAAATGPATARSRYHGARVPAANLLGGEGMGFALAQSRLGPGRIHHCMRWIGVCERAFDIMCRHAVERELAPGKPLGTKQTIQEWIADSRAEIDAARLMVLHAAWRIENEGAHAAREEISLIKFSVAGRCNGCSTAPSRPTAPSA